MKFDKNVHRRRSIRLKNFAYSTPGIYFMTACTHGKISLFGDIDDNTMHLNAAGQMIETWWDEINSKFPHATTDQFIIMPNHVHGLVAIDENTMKIQERMTLSKVVQWFKTMTTNQYIRNVKTGHWQPFEKRLWQRNYYEHIVRSEEELNQIREYILYNPFKWEKDRNHPDLKWKKENETMDWFET